MRKYWAGGVTTSIKISKKGKTTVRMGPSNEKTGWEKSQLKVEGGAQK